MWGKERFLRQLQREMPLWRERGWLAPGAEESIVAHISARGDERNLLAGALAIFGVALFGSGVITFFAANWEGMSKGVRLIVLFGALWSTHGLAAFAIDRERHPWLWQAIVLLGVVLFGANIMLIAQTYHIESHYPNGVMFWALGGLLAAWLLPAQAALVFAIALALLWTGMERFDFDHIHWPFLAFLAAAATRAIQANWRSALHACVFALVLWSVFAWSYSWSYRSAWSPLYAVEFFFLGYLSLFELGLVAANLPRIAIAAKLLQRYGVLAVLLCAYALSFPDLYDYAADAFERTGTVQRTEGAWPVVFMLAVLAVLVAWHRVRVRGAALPGYLAFGQGLIVACVVFILATLALIPDMRGDDGGAFALVFNLLYFAGLAWLVWAGTSRGDRFLVNAAFAFFALLLFTRYIDTFWTLMNRSFFFMAGGALLLAGGWLLERQRRTLTQRIREARS